MWVGEDCIWEQLAINSNSHKFSDIIRSVSSHVWKIFLPWTVFNVRDLKTISGRGCSTWMGSYRNSSQARRSYCMLHQRLNCVLNALCDAYFTSSGWQLTFGRPTRATYPPFLQAQQANNNNVVARLSWNSKVAIYITCQKTFFFMCTCICIYAQYTS